MAVPSGPPVLTKCSQVFRDVRYSSTGCCWGFSRALLRSAVGVGLLIPTPLGRLEINLCLPLRGSQVKTQLENKMDSDCDAGGHGQSLFRTDRACAGLIHKDEWELHKEQRRTSHTRDLHYITLKASLPYYDICRAEKGCISSSKSALSSAVAPPARFSLVKAPTV